MVQIENEYGSYGSDKEYLRYLVALARLHLGDDVILYTTDSRYIEHFQHGTIPDDGIYAAIDFPTWFDPLAAFDLQKQFNAPGKSPALSSEFYTGWLTHWSEEIAQTNASDVAVALENILSMSASVVLYMAHGGTNFGFFSGAESGVSPSIYRPYITSYDYDAPIREDGDTSNAKFKAIRDVIGKYSLSPLPSAPELPRKKAYGTVVLQMLASFFDVLELVSKPAKGVQMKRPVSMEALDQNSGFVLYKSQLPLHAKPWSMLYVQTVYDRAQIFIGNTSNGGDLDLVYLGIISRWSSLPLQLPLHASSPGLLLYILVENMGHVNYGNFLNDSKGINSRVLLDSKPIHEWTMYPIHLNDTSCLRPMISSIQSFHDMSFSKAILKGPVFYKAQFNISQAYDTFLSMRGWTKGVAFINGFNLGRYWPMVGPQCTLYIPAPLLQIGENELILFELEKPSEDYTIHFISKPDFNCGKLGTFSTL
eukprot:Gb_26707 [translate_table: standard]